MGPAAFRLASGRFDEGGKEVSAHYGVGADGTRFGYTRPPDEKRFSDASLVEPPLPTAEGEVGSGGTLGSRETAIVGSKGDHHLIVQAEGLQLV